MLREEDADEQIIEGSSGWCWRVEVGRRMLFDDSYFYTSMVDFGKFQYFPMSLGFSMRL
jgi:hypothetical protein